MNEILDDPLRQNFVMRGWVSVVVWSFVWVRACGLRCVGLNMMRSSLPNVVLLWSGLHGAGDVRVPSLLCSVSGVCMYGVNESENLFFGEFSIVVVKAVSRRAVACIGKNMFDVLGSVMTCFLFCVL